MPIISTLAGVPLSTLWKKKSGTDEDYDMCNCLCCWRRRRESNNVKDSVQKVQGQITLDTQPRDVKDSTVQLQNKGKESLLSSSSSSSVVRRTPFCSLNGKAYAVPISMTKEFYALLERAQSVTDPEDLNSPVYSSLKSPGVLWRHDPYSMKVIDSASSFSSSEAEFEPVSEFEELPEYKNNEEPAEPLTMVENVSYPYSMYDTNIQNSIYSFPPTPDPYGSVFFVSAGGSYYPGMYAGYRQVCHEMPLPQQFQPMYPYNVPTTTTTTASAGSVISDGIDQIHNWKSSSVPIIPSSRPVPSPAGTRLVIRSFAPPPPQPVAATTSVPFKLSTTNTNTNTNTTTNTSTLNNKDNNGNNIHNNSTDHTMMTAHEETDHTAESEHSKSRSSSHHNHPRRRLKVRRAGESDDQRPDGCPATLPLFHRLAPLFVDLAAYTHRRPNTHKHAHAHVQLRAPYRCDESDASTRDAEVHFVYLVAHRCRRSVAAAAMRYEVGALVVLEGDMGIEMGAVHTVLPMDEFARLSPQELSNRGFPADGDVRSAAVILRGATSVEQTHYTDTLPRLESDLLAFLQQQLDPTIFLDCNVRQMEFLGCEFQADCKKIYVYYRAKKRVLFRELAQYLHSFYRCRIWLHEVGKGEATVSTDSSRETDN
ncbi:uncharacterized protein TM35_000092290 [Trypanosoma theileri]|uniref:PSP1 C-terminal domain-containing protein n=1 Tax=Trypanosoma theileri TaxID=67003 RepID=A0A1X0P0X6_9TRYP|nr:uncharacterized protein TM35_000092290 [Trypanosoma theileri]ORC90179.1 hypothetical protein TM35_000092290 [Trypanosoma theileri]